MAPSQWDDTMEKQLLLLVIHVEDVTVAGANWEKVAALMPGEFTGSAVKQRFHKLKRDMNAAGTGEAGAPKTPSKRGGGKKAEGEKSTGKRKKNDVASEEDVVNSGADGESPTKKVKAEESDAEEA